MKQPNVILVLFTGLCASFMVDAMHTNHNHQSGSGGCHSDSDCHCTHGRPTCSRGSCHCVGCHYDNDCHCTHGRPSCSRGSCHCVGCHYDNDCHCTTGHPSCSQGSCHCTECRNDYDCQCSLENTPSCSQHGNCHCTALSSSSNNNCNHDADCSSCSEYEVGQCSNHHCTCSAEISCNHNIECYGFGCVSDRYPQCATLDGLSRCLCEPLPSSSNNHCENDPDCSNCLENEVGHCNNNQCTCSSLKCEHNSDCNDCPDKYQVGECKDNKCTCSATATTTKQTTTTFSTSAPSTTTTTFSTSAPSTTTTTTTVLTSTHSTAAETTKLKTSESAVPTTTTAKPTTIPPISTDIPSKEGKSTASLTTTVPTTTKTESPKTPTLPTLPPSPVCLIDTDCNGHICPSLQHPYCKLNTHSSSCHCTDCIEDTHCFCLPGLIGKCHLDIVYKTRYCVCGLLTEISTSISTTPSRSSDSYINETATTLALTSTSTSAPKAVRKCHSCGDANNTVSCDTRTIYLGNLQSCESGEEFCMTDIVLDGSPYPKTYKRCVTEEECRNKWLHQTSDMEYCINYGNVPMTGQYSCHFCCVTDGCNAGQVPDKSTFYSKA